MFASGSETKRAAAATNFRFAHETVPSFQLYADEARGADPTFAARVREMADRSFDAASRDLESSYLVNGGLALLQLAAWRATGDPSLRDRVIEAARLESFPFQKLALAPPPALTTSAALDLPFPRIAAIYEPFANGPFAIYRSTLTLIEMPYVLALLEERGLPESSLAPPPRAAP
ncbi:MAG: hypothetical protein HYR85_10380 [Planctomycetes bacterium]|nr:hypothetical protein [Planctomycetota bacterium]MBI3847156.1 hypothetical protein [Planctomycetota bacterium]